jgi:hypothetical protein
MANGFNYESPLNRLLSVTLPQFISQQTSMARDERNRVRQEERDDKRYLQDFNRNETRYQDGLRRQTELDNRDFDSNLINQGSSITNLQSQKDYYTTLLKSGNLKSTAGYDLSEARVEALGSGIQQAGKNVEMLKNLGIEEFYVNKAKDLYMQGNDVGAFNIIDTHLQNKFKDAQTVAQARLLMSKIDSAEKEKEKLGGVFTDPINI